MPGQQLRHRGTSLSSLIDETVDVGLSPPKMLRASPQQNGYVAKLHVSPFYLMLPHFFQRLIARIWLLSFLAPKWERRFLILLGGYLYKFHDQDSTALSGVPVPLAATEVDIVSKESLTGRDFDVAVPLENFPSGMMCVFVVTTTRKKYYYAAPFREMARIWVTSLRQARHETITRSMGHADADSYPASWEQFDRLGKSEMARKERIRSKVQEMSQRELEMSNLNEGGPIPRGYYG